MRRRDFGTALVGAFATAAARSSTHAQQAAMPLIGYLSGGSPRFYALHIAAFRRGLEETGYVEGQNVAVEYQWAEGRYDRLPALAADLVKSKVNLIAASGGPNAAGAAKAASQTIPIVFTSAGDPVMIGLVASLARPGGNLTGVSFLAVELNPKRFELLRELVPQAKVIALLVNPNNTNTGRVIRDIQEAAFSTGVQLLILKASSEGEIDAAFASLVQSHVRALFVATDPFLDSRTEHHVALAARHTIPAIYGLREFVERGGLISYGPSLTAVYRQAGVYAGRILKGAKPADLPVLQPTAFELVVNLKTANALGLTIPPSILARADEVIE
jgi:putative tryptophan/tyrosine transport system substrate-binding protein